LQTAALTADAEKSRADIAEANVRAAQAEQRAAEANLELARMKAPRTLSAEQQDRIVSKLRSFAGIKFDVGLVQGDVEAAELLVTIEAVLQKAGWNEIDWDGGDIVLKRGARPTAGIVTAANVAIAADPEKRDAVLGKAAEALAAALNADGILSVGASAAGFIAKNKEALHILIGRKT
jgi:hypothetical protein